MFEVGQRVRRKFENAQVGTVVEVHLIRGRWCCEVDYGLTVLLSLWGSELELVKEEGA